MSRFKKLADQAEQLKTKDQQPNQEDQLDFVYDMLFEGSLYYLFGCVETYFLLNGKTPPKPEEVTEHLKSAPKNFESDEEKKKYLKESKHEIDEFLHWFFFEKSR